MSVFDYHSPTPDQSVRLDAIRGGLEIALDILTANVPPCAERTIAFRHLEEAGFFASKAIVRDGERYLP